MTGKVLFKLVEAVGESLMIVPSPNLNTNSVTTCIVDD
jgi:hypothetical protein